MADTDRWLEDFGARHQGVAHAPVYWLAIPVTILGGVGLLWALPIPEEFRQISPVLNWGTSFLLASVVYYFIISLPIAFGLLPFVVGVVVFHAWLQVSPFSPLHASIGLMGGGLLGLYVARASGGGLRAVMSDLQHLMIAPAWLLSRLYHRFGIPH